MAFYNKNAKHAIAVSHFHLSPSIVHSHKFSYLLPFPFPVFQRKKKKGGVFSVFVFGSSHTMDWRKLESSYQLPYALSPRRKVVSGFSLGVGASLFVLTVLFLNLSVKSPFLKPMLFQKPRFGGNSSIVSWPFSFASPSLSSSSSSSAVTGNGSKSGTSEVKNAVGRVLGKTHEVNATPLGSDGAELGLKEIQLANATSEEVRNENFPSEERKVQDGTHEPKTAEPSKNGNFLDSEKTHLGNTSERGKNGSFLSGKGKITGEIPQGTIIGGHVNESVKVKSAEITENSSDGETSISGNNNVGNLLYNGDHEMAPRTEERDSGTTKMGNFSEKSGTTISSQLTRTGRSSYGSCDIFNGRWVRDDSKPYYPAGSCPYIDRDFDCHLNGRPDDGFVRWRWQPYGCDIPSLNATDFLERLRGKKLVFVGDSLNRNMWESLVCILRHSIRNKKRVYEISGSTDFKKKGVYAFRFEDYNCTVDFVGSPFLVRESSFKGKNGSFETLRLDLMDRTTSMYHDADVVVFNTGHWWTHEKTSKGEDYYQEGNHVHQRLKVLKAYKKALMTWARWIDGNIDRKRTQVFFRGYSVTHFRGGQWNSGGQCHKETEPISNDAYLAKYPSKMRALDHVLQEMRTPVVYLNISRLTDYRKDAHPSIYRKKYKTTDERAAAERSQDCSHWCLPGVPDTWNELLYASLLNVGRGSWRN